MKRFLQTLLVFLGIAAIVVSALSLLAWDEWWITSVKYPWEQITLASILVLALSFWVLRWRQTWVKLYLTLLIVAVLYQGQVLLPYTFLYPKAVETATPAGTTFQLMVANVEVSNRDAARFLALVEEVNPDVLQVIELSAWWQQQVAPLRSAYPHHFEQPQENAYGMALYSRLPLENVEVYHYENAETPSIYAELALPQAGRIALHALHPRPPLPENSIDNADQELIQVAQAVRTADLPVIVAGDFNDVPWSYTIEEFRTISGLQEPRMGRGFYNSFDAQRWWFRFPLDHIYLSDDLGLVDYARLPPFGSDHFALRATITVDATGAGNE